MAEDIIISGSVEDIIFHNSENGYSVFSVNLDDGVDPLTCVGIVPELHEGEYIKITGCYVNHPAYGRQLQIDFFEKTMPETIAGMEKYLASGIIKGIGAKTAKKIIKKFGEAAFFIIEEKPERLVEIRGITLDKAMAISRVFAEQHRLRSAMLFLQQYGISPLYAMKIYKRYKDRTMDIVKNNPYRLADDIFGIGFKMADKLAFAAGVQPESSNRIKAGIKYVLNQASSNGHVYMKKAELEARAAELLEINCENIENAVKELQIDGQLWQEKIDDEDCVYLAMFYYAEAAVAKKLLELSEEIMDENSEGVLSVIEGIERESGIHLDENQKNAVIEASRHGLLVITGGPGTGKTTTINTIIKMFEYEGLEITLAAPTGRAAKRMSEATGRPAQTIHRLLGISFLTEDSRRQSFDRDEENPIEADIIIIDEMSMVDILLMNSFLKAVSSGTRLILVGDVDQLPSVGAGNVLKDIIKSGRLNVARLEKIFRQAQESAIIMNAHRINKGQEPLFNDKEKDFFFINRAHAEDVVKTIRELVTTRLPRFLGKSGIDDIQVLTPMRKSPTGMYNLNMVLQDALNPVSADKNEKEFRGVVFREGDKVMQIKNNYNIVWKMYDERGRQTDEGVGVFNGDQGKIFSIDGGNETIVVVFDENKYVTYDFTQNDELELAYAITIHKSQGSEYPAVVLPVYSGPPMLMTRNLLYTGVTRARELVVLVGIKDTVSAMVANKREINRNSSLAYRIGCLYDFMNMDSFG